MAKTDSTVAVEFDTPTNSNVRFAPLQRSIRGRFDINRVAETNAGQLRAKFPQGIPGQRIEFDFGSGEGAIVETLREERYAAIRERIEADGMSLAKEREPFVCDAATFDYWMAGLIATGDAKLLSGTMPASMPGKPQKRFHSAEQRDPIDKLTAAIESQVAGQEKLIELLTQAITRLTK